SLHAALPIYRVSDRVTNHKAAQRRAIIIVRHRAALSTIGQNRQRPRACRFAHRTMRHARTSCVSASWLPRGVRRDEPCRSLHAAAPELRQEVLLHTLDRALHDLALDLWQVAVLVRRLRDL